MTSSFVRGLVRASRFLLPPVLLSALFLAAGAAMRPAEAQVGTTTQIITGRVIGPDSLPISGARVDITSVETGVVKHTATHADGRFSMLFRDGGAQYSVKITYIGMAPATVALVRQADEDRLVAEVRLGRTAVQLSAVQVRAQANRPGAPPASNAGGTGSALPSQLLERLPVLPGDLSAIAALAPGVIPTSATDTTPASFSVAGQPANQNNVTVDGSSFMFGSLPQDAVRSVRVVTNAYDVSRGQFTGGQVASTTKNGTAEFQGTATANRQQPSLQFPTSTTPTFGQKYTQTTGSFGVGGPVIKDRDIYYFGSLQYDRKTDAIASLLDASSGALTNLGANSDSVARFMQITSRDGVAGRAGAPATRTSSNVSTLARLDWDINESHSLMVRGDYRHLSLDATRISPLALPQTGGSTSSDGGGAMATLTSNVGNFINEGRVYASADHQSAAAFLTGPLGVVTVASGAGATSGAVASLTFGGNPGLPRSSTNKLLEISDELSRLVGTDHRIKLGGLLNVTRSTVGAVPNRYGTFVYNSLADFDAGHPALFARTLSGVDQSAGSDNAALYLGDAYRHSAALQVVYGLRAETTRLPNAPAENPAVTRAFGRSTSDWPTDFRVTPRVGFTYIFWGNSGIPSGSIRGGIGEFRGTVPTQLVGAVRNATGLTGTQTNLLCVGPSAPTPNWAAYLTDPGSIPSACANNSPTFSTAQPNIVLFDQSFGAPAVWRASFGATRRFHTTYTFSVDALFAYGVDSPFGTDINLPQPTFTLHGEGDRPVFVRPTDIVPITGTSGASTARPHSEFGPVVSLGSGLKSRTGQLMANLQLPGLRAGFSTVSYTFNRVLDQSNGYGLGSYLPTTAGNPNRIEWGTSDFERRHQLLGTTFIPFSHGFDFTAIGRLISGPRYTPLVNGDVNGDGQRNDRAFVPSLSGSAQSSDLAQLLATTDDRAADCIRSQAGGIAARNSCGTPWTPQLDLQVNWAPRAAMFDDRLTVSLVATNTLAGADRLLHGDKLHGWGQPVIPDRTLVSVTGFDAQSQQFVYRVNTHFGTPAGAGSAFLVPFQIGLRGHVTIGQDPVKAQVKAVTGGANGLPASLQEIKDRILKGVPYPVKALVDNADSLGLSLTRDQRVKLNAINTVYSKQIDSVGNIIAKILLDAGPRPDFGAIGPKLQSTQLGVIGKLTGSVKEAQGVLTAEQWAKLPEYIRLPLSAPPPGPRAP